MAGGLFGRVARFARSPQGRKLVNQAKEFANDPQRREQAKKTLKDLQDRVQKKGKDGGPATDDPPPKP